MKVLKRKNIHFAYISMKGGENEVEEIDIFWKKDISQLMALEFQVCWISINCLYSNTIFCLEYILQNNEIHPFSLFFKNGGENGFFWSTISNI